MTLMEKLLKQLEVEGIPSYSLSESQLKRANEILKMLIKGEGKMFTNSMSLSGDINMYSLGDNHRYDNGVSPEGRKVYFLNKNGYEGQLEQARKLFKEGQVLTVQEIYVGGSDSQVEFVEYPNQKFNTVMFADCE